ncbi:MAG TPA: SCP2 sterol-binding domain-containing protein [Paracoccaceae bacterium]|nr:SCP2 sterol-binding domain-containing protein [Paracoccaceae bacterium]
MSERLDSAAEALREKMSGSGFSGSVRFDMSDDGVLHVEDETVTTGDGEADCTITASMETFREMFEGGLDPTSAFMTGKIKIDGDMGVAMRLAQIL